MVMRNPIALLQSFLVPFFQREGSEWLTVECAFHNEKHNVKEGGDVSACNGGINTRNGVFKCFSCNADHQNVITFLAARLGFPQELIKAKFDNLTGDDKPGFVNADSVELWHQELLAHEDIRTRMLRQHGINQDSIDRFRLGYHSFNHRIIIPIKGPLDTYVNARQYKYDADKNKVIGIKGGKNVLFPLSAIEKEDIYLTEGEFKTILLHQYGFNAITGTAGAGSWDKQNWSELFKNKNVVIIYDIDEAGRKAADKVCLYLWPYAKTIKNVFLQDVISINKGDITNYFVDRQRTREDLIELINRTPLYEPPKAAASIIKLEKNTPIPVKLSQSGNAEYNNKIIESTTVVSAKDTAPYIIPKKCTVVCPRNRPYCTSCIAYTSDKPIEFEIPDHSPVLLELINTSVKQQDELLQQHSGINPKCNVAVFRRDESHNIEELRLIPQIAIGHTTEEQVTRKAYFVGSGLAPNNSYEIEGRVCAEPKDGHATMIIYKADPVQNDLDNFKPTMDLSLFQPKEWTKESVKEKLDELYEDLEANVTRIYKRRDLHIFYDLIWHTVLYIPFQGQLVKGWGDALCIGDSGQGKSECSTRLSEHYQCGERVDTKRASIAGIVGGLQETAKRWFITWGTIPLNDRRLVLLEEIKGMGSAELSKMTDMRSRGIAEITKIERAKTQARTRLIWISNPRSDSNLCTYNYGVEAVKELIGSLEDIRRFDMVIAVATGDVPREIINSRRESKVGHRFTTELCQQIIGWAWSRKGDQVKIECEDEILAAASRMGEMYSASCPIVEPSDQRLKILRLAAGLACRTYSSDSEGNVIVRRCHVEVIEEYLNRIYSSKALGYKDYSAAQKNELSLNEPEKVEAYLKELANCSNTVEGLIEADLIKTEDIINLTECTVETANNALGFLMRLGCIKRTKRGGYRKTPAFIELLKKMQASDLPNKSYKEILDGSDF